MLYGNAIFVSVSCIFTFIIIVQRDWPVT